MTPMTKIYLGSDHSGYYLKSKIIEYLKKEGQDIDDIGPYVLDKNKTSPP